MGALPPPDALAAPEQMRVCLDLEHGPQLWDASPRQAEPVENEDYGEDYGRWEGSHPFPAQRWLARVRDENTGEPLWGFAPLDEDGRTGATADIDYEDEDPTTFTIEYVKWAYWADGERSIVGYGCTGEFADPSCEFQVPREVFGVEAVPSGTTYATMADLDLLEEEYPVWAASFCEERLPLREDFEVYFLFDPTGMINDGTFAGYLFSGQPTVLIKGNGWHAKSRACHEYGHFQTFLFAGIPGAAIDYSYDPNNPGVPGDPSNHSFFSAEWQSGAAVEGFAHLYAVAGWSDVDRMGSIPYVECGAMENLCLARPIPRGSCVEDDGAAVDLGIANEWNWASALRDFRTMAEDTPDMDLLIGMVERAYDGGQAGWVATGDLVSSEFWENFVDQMDGYLVDDQQEDNWANVGALWCIDH